MTHENNIESVRISINNLSSKKDTVRELFQRYSVPQEVSDGIIRFITRLTGRTSNAVDYIQSVINMNDNYLNLSTNLDSQQDIVAISNIRNKLNTISDSNSNNKNLVSTEQYILRRAFSSVNNIIAICDYILDSFKDDVMTMGNFLMADKEYRNRELSKSILYHTINAISTISTQTSSIIHSIPSSDEEKNIQIGEVEKIVGFIRSELSSKLQQLKNQGELEMNINTQISQKIVGCRNSILLHTYSTSKMIAGNDGIELFNSKFILGDANNDQEQTNIEPILVCGKSVNEMLSQVIQTLSNLSNSVSLCVLELLNDLITHINNMMAELINYTTDISGIITETVDEMSSIIMSGISIICNTIYGFGKQKLQLPSGKSQERLGDILQFIDYEIKSDELKNSNVDSIAERIRDLIVDKLYDPIESLVNAIGDMSSGMKIVSRQTSSMMISDCLTCMTKFKTRNINGIPLNLKDALAEFDSTSSTRALVSRDSNEIQDSRDDSSESKPSESGDTTNSGEGDESQDDDYSDTPVGEPGEYDDEYGDDSSEEDDDGSGDNDDSGGGDQQSQDTGDAKESEKQPTVPSYVPDIYAPVGGVILKNDRNKTYGWNGTPAKFKDGFEAMMRDGDQYAFNPYGKSSPVWTTFSFRASDKSNYPQIAITPASFESLDSMDTMLDNIPYVVIKEYFFKNTASTMMNFVKKIMESVNEAQSSPKDNQGSQGAKSTGNSFMDKVKSVFMDRTLKEQVIDIPYILYIGLRRKLYGNTYIFPYIVDSSTVINEASNSGEWNGKGDGNLYETLKKAFQGAASMIGGLALQAMGSQGAPAVLFPAPTWSGAGDQKASFSFDLILINDHVVKARNNYMCVNTIIHNNRSIQKAILTFPGAIYEVWLPTGQRHLMCSGDFKLYPLGLNRVTPKNFFEGGGIPGANFKIGTESNAKLKQEHVSESEVIPDAYKLSCTFTSLLSNNMNTSVFQYYVDMTKYESPNDQPPGEDNPDDGWDNTAEKIGTAIGNKLSEMKNQSGSQTTASSTKLPVIMNRMFTRAVTEIVDDTHEKFDEATYNKQLTVLRTSMGEIPMTSDSAVVSIRKAQGVVRESNEFLSKLYNAENNNLWYKPFEKEEYYTTLKPDYRQTLRKRYLDTFSELRQVDGRISKLNEELESVTGVLVRTFNLDERDALIDKKVKLTKKLYSEQESRTTLVDDLLQIDVDMIQVAFDMHDDAITVGKRNITTGMFRQLWNEKIMNSYERDKIQYMTSKEKEFYFKDKIRELRKYDKYGILNHSDWFFRVAVLDFIVSEIQRLISLFKSCTIDDFDTVYKIIRKLNILQLDIDHIRQDSEFDINRTNLFHISDSDLKTFHKIDGILNGNTLYELFSNQMRFKYIKIVSDDIDEEKPTTTIDKELLQEQTTELDVSKRRERRVEIITRYWGSESELTRKAYANMMQNGDGKVEVEANGEFQKFTGTFAELKNKIIELKLTGENQPYLNHLLGGLSNAVRMEKERFIMTKLSDVVDTTAKHVIGKMDSSAKSKIK